MAFFRQSLIILSTIGLIIILKSFLVNSAVPLIGILILLYIIFSKLRKNNNFNLFFLIILIILLVLTTGSVSSPLFFLIYFLSFGIAFVFDPKVTFVFTAGLIVLLFPEALKTDLTKNLIMLFSIIFLSPIAYFFGKSFQENKEDNRKIEAIRKSAREIENDIEDILYDDSEKLDEKETTRLNRALLKAEELEEINDKK